MRADRTSSQQFYAVLILVNQLFGAEKSADMGELLADDNISHQAEACQLKCLINASQLARIISLYAERFTACKVPLVMAHQTSLAASVLLKGVRSVPTKSERNDVFTHLHSLQKALEEISTLYESAEGTLQALKSHVRDLTRQPADSLPDGPMLLTDDAPCHSVDHQSRRRSSFQHDSSTAQQYSSLNQESTTEIRPWATTIISEPADDSDRNARLSIPLGNLGGNRKATEFAFIKDRVFSAYVEEMSHFAEVFGSPTNSGHESTSEVQLGTNAVFPDAIDTNDSAIKPIDMEGAPLLTAEDAAATGHLPSFVIYDDPFLNTESWEDISPNESWAAAFNTVNTARKGDLRT